MSKVLVATIIGPGKQYCAPFLASTLRTLGGDDFYTVLDGAGWMPEGLPGDVEQLDEAYWQQNATGLFARQARMRNAARARFLSGDWTHLYFHDPDTIPPANVIPSLLAHGAPMVTALYNGRLYDTVMIPMDPQQPILSSDPLTLNGFGMGAMLISRIVLEMVAFQSEQPGEDIGFGRDAVAAGGWHTLLDTGLSCWHVREDGTANHLTVAENAPGVVWTDYPHFVWNRFGAWERNVARHDLTPAQIATLPPGFETDNYAAISLQIKPLAELIAPGGN